MIRSTLHVIKRPPLARRGQVVGARALEAGLEQHTAAAAAGHS